MGVKTAARRSVPAQPKTAAPARRFEAAWAHLEGRHAWRIVEEEVHNPELALARLPYAWQDYDNRRAAAFRERHRLDEWVAGAGNDWEAVLRLRHWAFLTLREGTPIYHMTDPLVFMEASRAGAGYWCTYYAFAFVAAASSLGYTARHLGIDSDREPDEKGSHHGVADVWVNSLRKWVAFDPHHDSHHEFDGVPLHAEELGQIWRRQRGQGIRTLVGPECREVSRARHCKGERHEIGGYYWHYIDCDNDIFHRRGEKFPRPVIFLVDEERKARTWYQGQPPEAAPHGRYENGTFVTTERYADAYPDLNCTALEIRPTESTVPYKCLVTFGATCVPNFSHYAIRENETPAVRFEGMEYPWRLLPGENLLEVQAVNTAGHAGPPSRVVLRVAEDASRKPAWPEGSTPLGQGR